MRHIAISLAAMLSTGAAFADTPPPPPEIPVQTAYEPVCAPANVTIYFSNERSDLTPQSRRTLESTIDGLKGCAVTEIRATTVSGDADNHRKRLRLSETRADAVLTAIAATGVWPNSVQSDIVLTRDNNRADTAKAVMERRVEVEFVAVRPISS